MFTGIVQGTARLKVVAETDAVRTIHLESPTALLHGLEVGGSVAVDGVCLTATTVDSPFSASFDVIAPTLATTSLMHLSNGTLVNVERAAKQGTEIGGHLLSGHVDFSSTIDEVILFGANKGFRIALPAHLSSYIFPKGYIAINGVSLTVSACDKSRGWFEVWLIPETRRRTNLDLKIIGDLLNIELERGTQVLVDTVRDAIERSLAKLTPALQNFDSAIREHVTAELAQSRQKLLTKGD